MSSIETLYLSGNTAGMDITTDTSITTLQLDDVATAQTYTFASNVANASVANMTANEVVDFAGNTVTGLTVVVSGNGTGTGLNGVATDVNLDLNSTAQTAVTFDAQTKASYIQLLNTGGALKTVNIKGDKAFGLNSQLTSVTTINASENTAGVNVVVEGASALAFTGGTGNDRIHTTATLTTTDTIVGGDGTDTFAVSEGDNVDTAAEVNTVSGFEVFEAVHDTDTAEAYDVSLFAAKNTFTGINITGSESTNQRVISVTKIGDGAKDNIKISLGSNDADGATLTASSHVSGGVSDTAKIILSNVDSAGNQVSAAGIDLGTVTFANVDVLSVVSTSDGSPTKTLAGGEAQKITSLVATDMDKLVVTGDEAIDITLHSTSASVSEIDASGMTSTAAVDIDTAGAAIASILVKGGAGADAITINNAATVAATVYTGGGNDAVTVVGGGTGVYTLKFTGTSLGGGDVKAGTAATVAVSGAAAGDVVNIDFGSEIENLLKVSGVNLGTTATTPDLEAATLGSTTNVAINGAAAVYTMQIDLDGDGTYVAANDFQVAITLTGLTATNGTAVYNSTTDMFVITAA
jgi:hypothetical protein